MKKQILLIMSAFVLTLIIGGSCQNKNCCGPQITYNVDVNDIICQGPPDPPDSTQMGFKYGPLTAASGGNITLLLGPINTLVWEDFFGSKECTPEQNAKGFQAAASALELATTLKWNQPGLTLADIEKYSKSAYEFRGVRIFLGEHPSLNQRLHLLTVLSNIRKDAWKVTTVNGFMQKAEANSINFTFQYYLMQQQRPGVLIVPPYNTATTSTLKFDWAVILQVTNCSGNVIALIMWPIFKTTPVPGTGPLVPCPPGVECPKGGRISTASLKSPFNNPSWIYDWR